MTPWPPWTGAPASLPEEPPEPPAEAGLAAGWDGAPGADPPSDAGAPPGATAVELLAWLREDPSILEPGLRWEAARPWPGSPGPLRGRDALGQPVLAFAVERFSPEVFDALLELAGESGAPPPRVLIVAAEVPLAAQRRLEILCRAFPLRALAARAGDSGEGCMLKVPRWSGDAEEALQGLGPEARRLGHRLLRAAAALRPPVQLAGAPWPILLRCRDGRPAALHHREGRLVFVEERQGGPEPLPLRADDDVDAAIDRLLRRQCIEAAAAAGGETAGA